LSRTVEFSSFVGFFRAESKFIEQVPVDPVIAALLGISSASRVSYAVNYTPNLNGRLSKTFAKGAASVGGGRTINPGNGLFLTSYSTYGWAGYSYGGFRKWSFNTAVSYNTSTSVGNISGQYSQTVGSVGTSRRLGRMINVVFDYSIRDHGSRDYNRYNRLIHTGAIGLAIAPGEVPLRVW
jgi:hypothetical protein